jgi:predicted amidohydrolase YtcJ
VDPNSTPTTGLVSPLERRILVALSLTIAIALACGESTQPEPALEPADAIFVGSILTLVEDESEAEALAIRGDRILAVGSLQEVLAHRGAQTQIEEIGEGALLPGFIDAHGHLTQLAAFVDFANVASPPVGPIEKIEQLQNALRTQADKTAEIDGREWIIGSGYDESLLAEGRHPTRDDLDAVSMDRPVFIVHVSMHLGVANSRALELAGIVATTPNPKSGVIRRRPGTQEPNGVLEEHAAYAVLATMPPPTPASMIGSLEKALAHYARNGYSTIQDGATSPEGWDLLVAADQAGVLQQDVIAYPIWLTANAVLEKEAIGGDQRDRLSLGGIKFVLDGSPQGKTAFLTQPYHVPPSGQEAGYLGYPAMTDQELATGVQNFAGLGYQIMAHANGDAAVDQLIAALEQLEATDPKADRRPILIHGQATRLDQLAPLARLGVVPSFFSAHTYFWGDWHRDSVFGPERAQRISPTASARAEGLVVTVHMDAPVLPPDSLRMIWATVNRRTRSGQLLGGEERLPVMAAIAATTRNAAHQHFLERDKGTLEAGKLADLVLLSRDPRKVEPEALAEIEVLGTWSHGQRIH